MHEAEWEVIDPEMVRITGLLYMINRTVLWPIGLAVRLTFGDDHPGYLEVIALAEPETITEGTINVDREPGGCHPARRFSQYAADRVRSMPTEMEQGMATSAIRKFLPGFAINPLRSIPEGVPSRDQDGTQEGS